MKRFWSMRAATSARFLAVLALGLIWLPPPASAEQPQPASASTSVAVGPQYDTTHIYVHADNFDAFVASFIATFGGTASHRAVFTVTPTPSKTASQYIQTPAGMVSVFAFQTPIPYPFGNEHVGYLVSDLSKAIRDARAAGADVVVDSFDDPIGKDAIIQWPGGWTMQLYWHTKAPSYAPLQTLPETRVYVSPAFADKFVRSFLAFSHGHIEQDELHADGAMIGRPGDTFRLIKLTSTFGKMTVLVTDGKLPYPYGRESTGYSVDNLATTMAAATAAGVTALTPVYETDGRHAVMAEFPGGYIAEIHDDAK